MSLGNVYLVYCKDVGVGPFHAQRFVALSAEEAVRLWVHTGITASGLPVSLANGVRLKVTVVDANTRSPRRPLHFWVTQRLEPVTVVTPIDDQRQHLKGAENGE